MSASLATEPKTGTDPEQRPQLAVGPGQGASQPQQQQAEPPVAVVVAAQHAPRQGLDTNPGADPSHLAHPMDATVHGNDGVGDPVQPSLDMDFSSTLVRQLQERSGLRQDDLDSADPHSAAPLPPFLATHDTTCSDRSTDSDPSQIHGQGQEAGAATTHRATPQHQPKHPLSLGETRRLRDVFERIAQRSGVDASDGVSPVELVEFYYPDGEPLVMSGMQTTKQAMAMMMDVFTISTESLRVQLPDFLRYGQAAKDAFEDLRLKAEEDPMDDLYESFSELIAEVWAVDVQAPRNVVVRERKQAVAVPTREANRLHKQAGHMQSFLKEEKRIKEIEENRDPAAKGPFQVLREWHFSQHQSMDVPFAMMNYTKRRTALLEEIGDVSELPPPPLDGIHPCPSIDGLEQNTEGTTRAEPGDEADKQVEAADSTPADILSSASIARRRWQAAIKQIIQFRRLLKIVAALKQASSSGGTSPGDGGLDNSEFGGDAAMSLQGKIQAAMQIAVLPWEADANAMLFKRDFRPTNNLLHSALQCMLKEPGTRTRQELETLRLRLDGIVFFRKLEALLAGKIVSLLQDCYLRQVPAGHNVCLQGAPTDGMYVVVSGSVDVLITKHVRNKYDPFGPGTQKTSRVAILPTGASFGEVGLVENKNRGATVATNCPAQFIFIPRRVYMKSLQTTLLEQRAAKHRLLKEASIFVHLSHSPLTLTKLHTSSTVQTYEPGTVLCKQGSLLTKLFVIDQGECRVLLQAAESTRHQAQRSGASNSMQDVLELLPSLKRDDCFGMVLQTDEKIFAMRQKVSTQQETGMFRILADGEDRRLRHALSVVTATWTRVLELPFTELLRVSPRSFVNITELYHERYAGYRVGPHDWQEKRGQAANWNAKRRAVLSDTIKFIQDTRGKAKDSSDRVSMPGACARKARVRQTRSVDDEFGPEDQQSHTHHNPSNPHPPVSPKRLSTRGHTRRPRMMTSPARIEMDRSGAPSRATITIGCRPGSPPRSPRRRQVTGAATLANTVEERLSIAADQAGYHGSSPLRLHVGQQTQRQVTPVPTRPRASRNEAEVAPVRLASHHRKR